MALNLPDSDTWAKVQNPDDPTNWVVLSYAKGSKADLAVASGTGGLAEFCATLKDDAIHYGGFVVYGVEGRGTVAPRREKFVQITWIGANVKMVAKSKVAGQRSKAMAYFRGYHIAYQIVDGDRGDISKAELEKKLLQTVGGAHMPEYYDFGGGSFESGGKEGKEGTPNAPEHRSVDNPNRYAAADALYDDHSSEEGDVPHPPEARRATTVSKARTREVVASPQTPASWWPARGALPWSRRSRLSSLRRRPSRVKWTACGASSTRNGPSARSAWRGAILLTQRPMVQQTPRTTTTSKARPMRWRTTLYMCTMGVAQKCGYAEYMRP